MTMRKDDDVAMWGELREGLGSRAGRSLMMFPLSRQASFATVMGRTSV